MARKAESQLGLDRISVTLIPKASEDLEALSRATGLSKTDLVNRAVQLYAFVVGEQSRGQDLALRDQDTGETQRVRLL